MDVLGGDEERPFGGDKNMVGGEGNDRVLGWDVSGLLFRRTRVE